MSPERLLSAKAGMVFCKAKRAKRETSERTAGRARMSEGTASDFDRVQFIKIKPPMVGGG